MATLAQRAVADQKAKLSHELKMQPKLKGIFRQMAKDLKLTFNTSQKLINPINYEPEFKAVITQRSRMVANEFKTSLRRYQTKDDVDDEIDAELLAFLILFVNEQIGFITQTTQEQLELIMRDVMADLTREGIPTTKQIVAQKMSERFLRQGMARAELIASEVVNTVAERTKFIEAVNVEPTLKKTWFTNIDGKERDTHHNAFMQEREINKPFNVGGSLMMFPKDRSLGASSKEIFRCRCSAIYG
jgi:hypothetical protein